MSSLSSHCLWITLYVSLEDEICETVYEEKCSEEKECEDEGYQSEESYKCEPRYSNQGPK